MANVLFVGDNYILSLTKKLKIMKEYFKYLINKNFTIMWDVFFITLIFFILYEIIYAKTNINFTFFQGNILLLVFSFILNYIFVKKLNPPNIILSIHHF